MQRKFNIKYERHISRIYFIYSRFQNLKKEPLTKGSDRGTEVCSKSIHYEIGAALRAACLDFRFNRSHSNDVKRILYFFVHLLFWQLAKKRFNMIPSKISSCFLTLLAPTANPIASGCVHYNQFCLNIDLFLISFPLFWTEEMDYVRRV